MTKQKMNGLSFNQNEQSSLWLNDFDEKSLSTSKGFVFQFPPFPTLPAVEETVSFVQPSTGLYFHIPFCAHKCSFCYYATSITKNPKAKQEYLDALVTEMASPDAQNMAARHDIRTLYIGGGTPTTLEPMQLASLVDAIYTHFDCKRVEEFTVETTPNSLTIEKAKLLKDAGVSRLSMGVQSFSDEINRINDRAHTAEESLRAIKIARQAGIDNINVDLICGLVGETTTSWAKTIGTLLDVAPEHVTTYMFSLRPQTAAYEKIKANKLPTPPNEAKRVEFYLYAREQLLNHGYVQTAPNCYAKDARFEHIHQKNAWSSYPLIGFGNSAYSFVDNRVTQSVGDISGYIDRVNRGVSPLEIGRELNTRELMSRYAILRLKLLQIVRKDFKSRFGYDVTKVFAHELSGLEKADLLKVTSKEIKLTPKGAVYADDVCRALYTPDVRDQLAKMERTKDSPSAKKGSKQLSSLKLSLV